MRAYPKWVEKRELERRIRKADSSNSLQDVGIEGECIRTNKATCDKEASNSSPTAREVVCVQIQYCFLFPVLTQFSHCFSPSLIS
jgi:hypothetical protein